MILKNVNLCFNVTFQEIQYVLNDYFHCDCYTTHINDNSYYLVCKR